MPIVVPIYPYKILKISWAPLGQICFSSLRKRRFYRFRLWFRLRSLLEFIKSSPYWLLVICAIYARPRSLNCIPGTYNTSFTINSCPFKQISTRIWLKKEKSVFKMQPNKSKFTIFCHCCSFFRGFSSFLIFFAISPFSNFNSRGFLKEFEKKSFFFSFFFLIFI